MPEDTLGVAKPKTAYPFLKEIWKTYKIEDNINETRDRIQRFPICEENSMYGGNPTDIQKKACRKLLKNFELLHTNKISLSMHNEWCNNINNWIYYEINPYILDDDIISRILVEAQEKIFMHMPNKHYCRYTILDKRHKPQELNKLRIFKDNTDTFKTILFNKHLDNYCPCINFVNDCINIYRTFQSQYCLTANDKYKNNKDTCDIVNWFNILYTGFLHNKYLTIQEKLPDLHSTNGINLNNDECQLQTKEKELDSAEGDQMVSSTSSTTPTERVGKTMPTAIGTIAGVSSVLGILYKFSPAGTWMHSGLRGNGRIINSNLYADGGRELLSDGPLIENLNSYNIGYDVA